MNRIIQACLQSIGLMVSSPVYWITLWITYRYYLQYEWDKASAKKIALASFAEGLTAGIGTVCLMLGLGLTIKPGIALLGAGPLSMLLSLIRPRFFCMAYGAGAALCLCWLLGIATDSAGILSLVAVLHLTEGLLVIFCGGRHTVSIYRQRKNRLYQESGIYRFWPVPICLLMLVSIQSGTQAMPDWWPLLSPEAGPFCVYGLFPLTVTLGYSDLSEAAYGVKRQQIRNGFCMLLYALILLGLGLLSARVPAASVPGVLFMVLGHERMIRKKKTGRLRHISEKQTA